MTIKGKKSLTSGRPPSAHKPPKSWSSKATRSLIRSHHQLQKALANAEKSGDEVTANTIRHHIDQKGGLQSYQEASLQGQSKTRGGDTSTILLEWLKPHLPRDKPRLRMLEVGALSTSNACSKSSTFNVTRIDLNSQSDGIEQQDFMARPLPISDEQRFHVISLSLVVNYVPSIQGRGEMLKRTRDFLLSSPSTTACSSPAHLPSLFLVLPAPCITNSRYMDEKRLSEIMTSLGFVLAERKLSSKLAYHLWALTGAEIDTNAAFPKIEVNSGGNRNNFCIVLE